MGRNIFRQEEQIRKSDLYDDTIAPSLAAYETNPVNIEDDLNRLRSFAQNALNRNGAGFPAGDWYADITQPTALENGAQRGISQLGIGLHAIEKKRVLRDVHNLTDITVGAGNNFSILTLGQLPTNTTAAVGAVTTLGTVIAFHAGTFGTHSLDEVAGVDAISPKNLLLIVDGDTRDPILSGGRQVYGLLQSETATDGHTLTGTTPVRAQISYVRINAAGSDLEAVPVADIENRVINYTSRERVRLEDLNEADFLRGAVVDVPAGSTVTRQIAYVNQGTTPVDQTTNAILDLEAAGIAWRIRDDAEANLFSVIEGSAGGTSEVEFGADVDLFDNDAAVNNFLNGLSVDTGAAGTTINLGVTANEIDSGGALTVRSAAATQLKLAAGGRLALTDSFEPGSWSLDGIALSDAALDWTDFEAEFGEVSLMRAIVQAASAGGIRKVHATVTSNVSANVNVSGPSDDNNLDADLGDLSSGSFIADYDIYYNGQYQRPGADASANHDVYPGTSLANGQLRFEHKLKNGDEIAVFDRTP